mmetsp:Transcript_9026/g.20064  ORF Transcript_9026/g.20064 Transcript_9026/m.20064 type:complete len:381 (-) Transcript_9026:163-1305(-)
MQTMRPGPSGYHRDGGHGGNAYGGNGGNFGRHEKGKKLEYAFFSGTSPKFMDAITKMLEKQSFEKQDYLFKEGDVGFNMYFISSGSVILCSSSALQEVEVLSRGSHCGDLALLGSSKRLSNAIAREHTECLVLRNRHFQAILERFPEEKEYFGQVALERKKQLKQVAKLHRIMEKGAGLRPRRAWREDSDSDRDATDDPAPKVPVEEETPLPDTEIPGAYPKMSKMNILDLAAPPRHGPEQLVPLKIPEVPETDRVMQARMGKELASVGRAAFARKMQVAEALYKEMAPAGASSLRPGAGVRPSSAFSRTPLRPDKKVLEVDENPRSGSKSRAGAAVPPAVKKALEEDDDDGFDVNFDLKTDFSKVNLNAVDPWRRAVSA